MYWITSWLNQLYGAFMTAVPQINSFDFNNAVTSLKYTITIWNQRSSRNESEFWSSDRVLYGFTGFWYPGIWLKIATERKMSIMNYLTKRFIMKYHSIYQHLNVEFKKKKFERQSQVAPRIYTWDFALSVTLEFQLADSCAIYLLYPGSDGIIICCPHDA